MGISRGDDDDDDDDDPQQNFERVLLAKLHSTHCSMYYAKINTSDSVTGPLRIELKFLLKFLRSCCARTFTPERLQLQL